MQVTDTVVMIRPVSFRMNEQTAVDNYFMEDLDLKNTKINSLAQLEFDRFVTILKDKGINVIIVDDTEFPDTPDAVFPNNWVSFHEDGTTVFYPMLAENRRQERREDILDILEDNGFLVKDVMDYTAAEQEGIFLEGTGSLVLDRVHKKAYCALSQRADEELLIEFCEDFDYFPVLFTANQTVDGKRLPIYHTNVMMSIAEEFAVVCLEAIDDKKERKNLVDHLKRDGKDLIAISGEQMHRFAGNMLQVKGKDDKRYTVMSNVAYGTLTTEQLKRIERSSEILYANLETIETCGGGSARCMMAEVFLPKKLRTR